MNMEVMRKAAGVHHLSLYWISGVPHLRVKFFKGEEFGYIPYPEKGQKTFLNKVIQEMRKMSAANKSEAKEILKSSLPVLTSEEYIKFQEIYPDLDVLTRKDLSVALRMVTNITNPRLQLLLKKLGEDEDVDLDNFDPENLEEGSIHWRLKNDLGTLLVEYNCI